MDNYKLVVIFDSFESEEHARFFATWLQNEVGYVHETYLVTEAT